MMQIVPIPASDFPGSTRMGAKLRLLEDHANLYLFLLLLLVLFVLLFVVVVVVEVVVVVVVVEVVQFSLLLLLSSGSWRTKQARTKQEIKEVVLK